MPILIVATVCVAGMIFMARFFLLLCEERKSSAGCYYASVRRINASSAPRFDEAQSATVYSGTKEVMQGRMKPVVLRVDVSKKQRPNRIAN
jgi:hypothetical protein